MGLELAPDCVGAEVEKRVWRSWPTARPCCWRTCASIAGEEANDPGFVGQLARLCDVYVNDAFGTAHRAHASTEGLARACPERAAGFLMAREIDALTRVRDGAERPFVCVLGGAKVSDKLGVLEALSAKADVIVIGGAMAYTFLLARDEPVGRSLVEPDRVETARRLLDGPGADRAARWTTWSPRGSTIAAERRDRRRPSPTTGWRSTSGRAAWPRSRAVLASARTVFWNGPLGLFETPPFDAGTMAVARALAASDAYSVVGGGDSLAAAQASGVADRFSHLSTGGGASLEFVEGRTLPGLEALT